MRDDRQHAFDIPVMQAQQNPPPRSSFILSDWCSFSHTSFFPTDSNSVRKVTAARTPTHTAAEALTRSRQS